MTNRTPEFRWSAAMKPNRDYSGIAHAFDLNEPGETVRLLCGARPFSLGGAYQRVENTEAQPCKRCLAIVTKRQTPTRN